MHIDFTCLKGQDEKCLIDLSVFEMAKIVGSAPAWLLTKAIS